ncbi:NnrU family protein [Sphingomonas flavescens]|uniref:NnrU family protein n=1 Tax=Sphingomonas flavescens TaxID=3132797 RepID=UPI002804558E|nr:NnrU family protein [Sphingomonas limnosediminicola]
MTPQAGLFLSALAFVGTHFLMSHPLRGPMVRAMGEKAFQGVYSLISLILFGLMIYFYRVIGREPPLWDAGQAGWVAGTILMWLGSVLFVGSFVKNPALPGAKGPRGGPHGVFTITRHPMMWGFASWAAVHLAVVAMPKAMVFDGAILVLALFGAAGQDSKKAAQMGEAWHEWTAQTAFIPFSRGVGNPGAVALIGGTLLFLIATWAHPMPAGIWRWIG